MIKLPSRQVHLDFHTSEHVPDVGARFDKARFQEALKVGHVDSITVFAKCHHSWSYYPTRVGKPHPNLKRDLLGSWIGACHEIGVRAPVYYTVGWSANDAVAHPDWRSLDPAGEVAARGFDVHAKPEDPKPEAGWIFLCPSGGYLELMLAQTEEICRAYPVDGFFYDICFHTVCYCPGCLKAMKDRGLDAKRPEDAEKYHVEKWQTFMAKANAVIQGLHPEATVFYNGGARQYTPQWHVSDTHFELEDLPTTWGGYDKFPIRAKYFAGTGKQYLAMSGKFHTSWGEFGGFKHPDAIRYEAAAMTAFGARCSFGDQAHPSGEMDPETYRNIGAGYKYVKAVAKFGLDGRPYARLGLWLCGREADDQGTANMLLESQTDFDTVQPRMEPDRFDTIVLPGGPCLDAASAKLLTDFTAGGGKLVVLGEGALDAQRTRFLLDTGARYEGPARCLIDYLVAGPALSKGLVASPFLDYEAGLRTAPEGAEVLAAVREPYFDRTYGHYCSHANTPYRLEDTPHPGAWRKGGVLSFAHGLGRMYYQHGARLHRDLFLNGLRLLYRNPALKAAMPSAGRINLIKQAGKGRYVAHLLYAPPLQRGRCLVIEDIVPIGPVPLELRVPERVKRVSLPLEKKSLKPTRTGRALQVVVPEVRGHQIVVFEY